MSRLLRGLPARACDAPGDLPLPGVCAGREPGGVCVPVVCPTGPGAERRNPHTRVPGVWSIAYRITERLLRLKIWP